MQRKSTSLYILRATAFSVALLLSATVAHAQARKQMAIVETDTVPLLRGVALSADVVGVAQRLFGDYGQLEAGLRVNLRDRYFPVAEIGWGTADAEDVTTRLTYKTSAPYLRVGCDFNMMKNKHDDNRVYLGLRYALTSFKYDVWSPGITDPVWQETVAYEASDVSCYYHWLEAVAGVDAKLWGPLRLGWSVRYKRRLLHDEGPLGNAWYVPGYGKQGGTRLGGSFHVIIEI